jgi:hypothetical protein
MMDFLKRFTADQKQEATPSQTPAPEKFRQPHLSLPDVSKVDDVQPVADFQFGGPVKVGEDVMSGVCSLKVKGMQPCSWNIKPAETEDSSRYKVRF